MNFGPRPELLLAFLVLAPVLIFDLRKGDKNGNLGLQVVWPGGNTFPPGAASTGFRPAAPLQIKSFSVGPDQTLTYPDSSSDAKNQLAGLADDHTTLLSTGGSGAPYLVFAGAMAGLNSGIWGAVVLQSPQLMKTTDLTIFDFAPGYNFPVLTSPNRFTHCNPPGDNTEFDENYAAPGSVLQDPTLPAGNLIMIYHAENHCPDGRRISINFSTLPSALPGLRTMGKPGPNRKAARWGDPAVMRLSSPRPHRRPVRTRRWVTPPPAPSSTRADGNYYLYVAYVYFSGSGPTSKGSRPRQNHRAIRGGRSAYTLANSRTLGLFLSIRLTA